MATSSAYFSTADRPALPPALRHARTLMLVWAAFAVVWAVISAVTLASSAVDAGVLIGAVLPEIAGGVLALRMARLPRWPLLTITIIQIALAAGDLLSGSLRSVVQLVVPVVVLVLLIRGYRSRARTPDPYWQAGASMIQYAGLVVLAALILGALVAVVPGNVETGTRTEICKIFYGTSCGASDQSGKNGSTGPKKAGTDGGDKGGNKGKDDSKCHGFWGCAWHYTGGQVYGAGKGIVKSVYQMGDGLVTSIAHPSQFIKGIGYVASHPGDAVKSILLGDAEKDWKNGDYGEAIGDFIANTGSLFIPGGDVAAGAGDAGKLGKLGDLGKLGKVGKAGDVGKLGKLGEIAGDADRAAADAAKAAKDGDPAKADTAAQKAEADAKKAEDQGRKDGCKIGALADVRITPLLHFGGRFAAPAEGDGCTPDEQKNLDEAEKAKKKAKADAWDAHLNDPGSLKGMDPQDVEKLIPDDWPSSPQKKGVGTKYVDPNKKGRQVLVEQGTPVKPGQTPNVHNGPYLKVSQNGKVERIPLKGNPTL